MTVFNCCVLGKATALPPDVLDQITAMQKAIDKLTADLASVSVGQKYTHAHFLLSLSLD